MFEEGHFKAFFRNKVTVVKKAIVTKFTVPPIFRIFKMVPRTDKIWSGSYALQKENFLSMYPVVWSFRYIELLIYFHPRNTFYNYALYRLAQLCPLKTFPYNYYTQ